MQKFIVLGMALLLLPGVVRAQQSPAVTTTGAITAGTRQVDTDTNSSKFTEYRDFRDSALSSISFSLFDTRNGRFLDAQGANISLDDQTLRVRGGRAGAWALAVDWIDVPHNFSNKARTPYSRPAAGLFEVPANVPITFKKLATSAADTPGVLASDELISAYQQSFLLPTPLEMQTSFGRVGLQYSGLEAVNIAAVYDLKKRSGLKSSFGPIGDRPPRTLNIQLTEPVDHQTQDVTLSAEHVGRSFQVQASYLFSDFANRVDTLLWENVYATQLPDQTYDLWDRSVSTFGRRALAPDNRYHNVSLSAGGDLPAQSRVNATIAYGRFEQNETLLPYSYNANVLATQALPRSTAEAEIATTQLLLDYVIAPVARLNLRAWARYNGMDNNTPQSQWTYVTSDTSNVNGTVSFKNKRVNLAYAPDRTTAGAEAAIRTGVARSSLTLGYELEDVGREYREADTTENRLSVAFRARPAAWATVRVRYLFGDRDGTYDPYVTRQSYWYAASEAADADNPAFAFSNHPDMRRFDVADRRRSQADLSLTVMPGDMLSLSFSARYRNDDFDSGVVSTQPLAGTGLPDQNAATPGAQLGLLEDARQRYAIDAFLAPGGRASLNAFLSWDKGTSFERSIEFNENNKQNPSTIALAELGPWTRGGSEWTSDFDDRTFAAGLGTTIALIPDRLSLAGSYTRSIANLDITYGGFGRTNWDGTAFPPNHQFAFTSPPTVEQDLHAVDLRAEIPLRQGLSFVLGYGYERYRVEDWQQSGNETWVEPVGSEFLLRDTSRSFQWGNRLFNFGTYLAPSYDAHMGYAAFTYRF